MQSRLRANRQRLRDAGVDFLDLWGKEQSERQYRKKLKRIIEKQVLDESALSGMTGNLRQILTERSLSSTSLTVLS